MIMALMNLFFVIGTKYLARHWQRFKMIVRLEVDLILHISCMHVPCTCLGTVVMIHAVFRYLYFNCFILSASECLDFEIYGRNGDLAFTITW